MRRYGKYKPSRVEWLNEFPIDWSIEKLKFNANIQFSNVDKNSTEGEIPVRLCNYLDVYRNEKISHNIEFMPATASYNEIKKFNLKRGDILITKDSETPDDIAVPALVIDDFEYVLCGYHLAQIQAGRVFEPEYIFRLFQSKEFNQNFEANANGMTRYGLSVYSIKNVFIPIPSKEEQKVIICYLNYKAKLIDVFIANRKNQIELLREQLHFKINEAITKGIDVKVMKKDTDIKYVSQIPAHWEIRKFKGLTSILTCGYASTPEYVNEDEGVPFLSAQNSRPFKMDLSTYNYIKPELHKQLTRYKRPQRGDVLVTRVGAGIGEACMIDTDLNFSIYVSLTHIRPTKEILSEYIVYFFNTEYSRQLNFEGTIVGGGQGNLNVNNVNRYRIPLPPIDEQKEIIAYLDGYRNETNTLITKYEKQIELMKEYRTTIISNVVTGKIDVRDWKPKTEKYKKEITLPQVAAI